MARGNECRICEKKYSPNFATLFDSKVKIYESDDYTITYFEAMQQLTGMEVCTKHKQFIFSERNACLDCGIRHRCF